VIHRTYLSNSDSNNIYILGDLFLQHFYTIYDFDKEEVGFGVNIHSKDKVFLREPNIKVKF